MKLYYSKASPFARKAILSAHVLGLSSSLELFPVDVYQPPADYKNINPLIKVPALEINPGEILTNSPFICQYMNEISRNGKKIFPQGHDLWKALNDESIADGATEAAVARRWESHLRSPDKFDSKIDSRHKEKIQNALSYFEKKLADFSNTELRIQEISLLCSWDYLQFRFAHESWDQSFQKISAWAQSWNQSHPMIEDSRPK